MCHGKRTAGSFARLLQIKLQQRTRRRYPTFIDSDHLVNLNTLFNTVRKSIGHLVVVLNNATLTRPWCAGEITTAVRNSVPIIVLRSSDYTEPSRKRGSFALGFSYEESGLAGYGIEDTDIIDAYRAFHQITNVIHLPSTLNDTEVDKAVDLIGVHTQHISFHSKPLRSGSSMIATPSRYDGDVLVVSDFGDNEANSSVLILRHKLFNFVSGQFVTFPTQSDQDAESFALGLCESIVLPQSTARSTVLVMLSSNFLWSIDALILAALARNSGMHMN